MGIRLCDLIDLVLWDTTGEIGRWTGRIGDFGRRLLSSSSRSGVRERPSESLKLFSLGIVGQVVVEKWGEKASCSICLDNSLRALIRNSDLFRGRLPHSVGWSTNYIRASSRHEALYSYNRMTWGDSETMR